MMMFGYNIEAFLLNLFFIIFPLIFYQFIFKEKIGSIPIIKNLLLFCIFILPIILCMIFPASNYNGFSTNLHSIPFIVACLYSNPLVSFLIYISLVLGRFIIGGQGQYITLISATVSFVVIFFLVKKYHSLNLPGKMTIACSIVLVSKLVGKLFCLLFISNITLHVPFYIIECFVMALTLYTIETLLRNIQLKQEIIDAEKLKVASVISASVAHEIRNPLTSVRGFIQLLSATTDLTPDKRQLYGKICLEELDRAGQIINDYLSLAKPYPEASEQLDIGEEIKYVSTVLTSYSNLKGVELRVETESNLYVSGDRQKLRQCIMNIAKNGIEAMEQGGVLEFKVKKQSNKVILIICDSGSGMTKEQISRLGTPYFSTKEKGTGLGTMVSFNIIKNMLGKIKIESKVGEGTSFQISFPVEDNIGARSKNP